MGVLLLVLLYLVIGVISDVFLLTLDNIHERALTDELNIPRDEDREKYVPDAFNVLVWPFQMITLTIFTITFFLGTLLYRLFKIMPRRY